MKKQYDNLRQEVNELGILAAQEQVNSNKWKTLKNLQQVTTNTALGLARDIKEVANYRMNLARPAGNPPIM